MEILNHYYNQRDLIKLISKYRIKIATKRHDIHIINDIRSFYVDPVQKISKKTDCIILDILPPRSKWIKIRKREKYSNSTALNIANLEKTIHFYKKKIKNDNTAIIYDWYKCLMSYINDIRSSIIDIESYEISPPKIIAAKKDRDNRDDNAYRPIAHYEALKDKIIIGQAAKYLTDIFDSEFCDSASFAFRSKKNKKKAITHHDTILKILNYKEMQSGKDLWVAECDIKKFYDCVNHKVAKEALLEIIKRVEHKDKKVDKRAIKIFDLYLDSYSFNNDVFPLNKTNMIEIKGEYKWEEQELIDNFYIGGIKERVGVPQGGAISCLIANLILDKVDRSVLQVDESVFDNDLLYMRYCDDMIIIHPDKDKCNQALQRYLSALKECKLLCHDPLNVESYSATFWASSLKSKAPYRWAKSEINAGSVPWLSFVGYQVRYDGTVRIRKKSINKELKKQELITNSLLKAIRYKKNRENLEINVRRSSPQIIYRVEQKLISMSVGRVKLHTYLNKMSPQLSWTVGFKELKKNEVIVRQLKILDRGRTKQIKELKKKLKALNKPNTSEENDIPNIYFGSPFSYHNFILRK